MDRFERIYQLDRLLRQARYPIPPTTLCERLECSRATLYRSNCWPPSAPACWSARSSRCASAWYLDAWCHRSRGLL